MPEPDHHCEPSVLVCLPLGAGHGLEFIEKITHSDLLFHNHLFLLLYDLTSLYERAAPPALTPR